MLAGITLISFIFIMLFIIVAAWIDHGVKTECDLAKKELKLPVQVGFPLELERNY